MNWSLIGKVAMGGMLLLNLIQGIAGQKEQESIIEKMIDKKLSGKDE